MSDVARQGWAGILAYKVYVITPTAHMSLATEWHEISQEPAVLLTAHVHRLSMTFLVQHLRRYPGTF